MKPIILKSHEVIHLRDTGSVIAWRVVKFPRGILPDGFELTRMQDGFEDGSRPVFGDDTEPNLLSIKCPYGRTGEERWVKETFLHEMSNHEIADSGEYESRWRPNGCKIEFVADGAVERHLRPDRIGGSWMGKRPSTHMPCWASRFTVTLDIDLKRRQEVTEEEAKMSGANGDCPVGYIPSYQKGPCRYHLSQIMDLIGYGRAWSSNDYFWKITCTLKK